MLNYVHSLKNEANIALEKILM